MWRRLHAFLGCLAILICSSTAAWSTPTAQVQMFSDFPPLVGVGCAQITSTTASCSSSGGAFGTVYSASALAEEGTLKIFASQCDGVHVGDTCSGVGTGFSGNTQAFAGFVENLTLRWILPFPPPPGANITFSMVIDGALDPVSAAPGGDMMAQLLVKGQLLTTTASANECKIDHIQCDYTHTLSETLFVAPGDVFEIGGTLHVVVGTGCANFPFGLSCNFETIANFADTAQVFIGPLPEGFVLVSESGHDYSLPASVPEPSTWLLLGSGLAGLAGTLRSLGRRK